MERARVSRHGAADGGHDGRQQLDDALQRLRQLRPPIRIPPAEHHDGCCAQVGAHAVSTIFALKKLAQESILRLLNLQLPTYCASVMLGYSLFKVGK
jgi:hypothetical protein